MKFRILFLVAALITVLLLGACSNTPEAAPATAVPEVAVQPTEEPTDEPTEEPTEVPTEEPTEVPTEEPTVEPTAEPTEEPVPAWIAPEGALVSIPAAGAPTLDGMADDDIWANATAIQVEIEDGANESDGIVDIKSAYDDENVYFLVTWNDPTESFMRSPWVKQEDGTWLKLSDPDDRGGDNNIYYEDKMSFIWSIDNSIPNFENKGCFTACHSGEDTEFKPYGNKYTDEEGQMGDIWHWKSVRNLNQLDDQYLDSTRYSADTPEAGRHGDPKDGGGYVNNQNEDNTMPAFMGPEGYPVDGSPGFILAGEELPFDDSLFVAGDMVPGIVKAAFEGDRGNISAGWKWEDGVWTLEISRPLETGSEYDVQFSDMNAPYYFGVAMFDNAQVRHAYQYGANEIVFQPEDIYAPIVETEAVAEVAELEVTDGPLVSIQAGEAPTLDGFADDAIWADAEAIVIEVEDGANDADGLVQIKSVYTDDMVYFLVTRDDPTQSFMRSPWVKQDDGSWLKLSDPDDRGGDNNLYYEDKLSFIWPIDNSIPKFETQGCFTACHAGDDSEFKPYGNKNTDEEGQMGDIWHWKSVRNLNQLDDQYLDWTPYSADTPEAGRHGDPKDGGGYVNNQNEENTMPAFMGPEGYPVDGSPGFIIAGEELPFDDSLFVAGDMIPGIVKAPFEGDRGDISAGWHWEDGVWTIEIGRALETGSEYDVQFNDMAAPYYFGVAMFDNAQVRHAYQYGANEFIFDTGEMSAAPANTVAEELEVTDGPLMAVIAAEAPVLDGNADDAIWADAEAIVVEVEDGANAGDGLVQIKAAYDDDMIYFLVTHEDPTQSFMRSPWVKQDDDTWLKLSDPDDRGGDNNVYYEDKMSFIWPIDNSIPKFETQGCFTACHSGDDSEFKPYGNKNTDEEGQMGDIWHWKSVRNVNQFDDQYLDSTTYSADTPGAGRHGDPKDGGGYVNNQNEDNTMPAFMGPAGYPVDGSPGFIMAGEELPFDDSLFVAGDMIPGIVKAPFEGDRGDISAGWKWEDGVWTIEIARPLVTGSEYDVQFDDPTAPYYFGVAMFDNAQVRHAYQYGANELLFVPAE